MESVSQIPLHRMCEQALSSKPESEAIEFEGRWHCWGQLRAVADAARALLAKESVPAQAPIVFIPRNRPHSVAALLGMLAGCRTVRMVYAFQSPAAVARELRSLQPAVVGADAEDYSPEVRAALGQCRSLGIALRPGGVDGVGLETWDPTAHSQEHSKAPELEILTSGTTGTPKRFAMTHSMIAQHIVGAIDRAKVPTNPEPQTPAYLYYPLGNISGIYSVLPTLLRGHRVVLVERFSVDTWRDHILRHRPTRASLPPAGFQMVLDADIPPGDLASVRQMATGAAPLPLATHRAFEARYGIPGLLSYGATEFGGPVTRMTLELRKEYGDCKLASAGRSVQGAQLRVMDAVDGTPLPAGKQGVLEVLAPRVGPHWIRTSDLAVLDEDGFLFHRGRADGAIVRGGFKLLPATIEQALLLHPAVLEAVVVGLPDSRLGQVPAAAIQLRPGFPQPSVGELERHLREHVYATHVPVAWRIGETLPLNASLKVDRSAVAARFSRTVAEQDARAQ